MSTKELPHWEDQGWNDESMVMLLNQFISEKKLGGELEDYLQKVADEENSQLEDDEDDDAILSEPCDECSYLVPDAEEGSICNKYHATWCSLYNSDNE